ncbi:MAG: discoidin domain-containing protein, partial [Oscillospiraceae bacterium]|nr:discoidin domain-containing protein [Oscillospiraceae bacterium]
HEICVVTVAQDGIVRNAYRVDAVIPYEQNVELFTFQIDGKSLLGAFDENGSATAFVGGNTAQLNIVTKDPGATIQVDGNVAVGSYSGTVALVNGAAEVQVTITARDGVTTERYSLSLKKVMDPNDSSRDIPVSVLTATAGDWQTGYEATEGPANLVLDGNPGTIWHTDWYGTSRANHWIQFELSESYLVDGLRYQPRQGGSTNGTITEYEILVSDDGVNFRSVTSGNWANNTSWKGADFDAVQVKFVRLVAVNAVTDNSYVFASAAEIRLTGVKADAHVHSYTAVVTDPTCTEGGYTTYTCACGDSYIADETAALGHKEEILPGKDATCTETGLTEGKKCTVCNEILVEQTEIPALGHDFVNGECSRCDAEMDAAFVDVPVGSFFFDPVQWAVDNKITAGTTPTTFDPNGNCMRAVVVTFLWRAAGEPKATNAVNPFTDVHEGDYFYDAVLWAVENKITAGLTPTTFGPTALCNRAQVVTFLYRAMGNPKVNSTEHPFTDIVETEFYYTPMLWAVENGITAGLTATTFGPTVTCNRAQVVTFLYRCYNK